VSRINTVQYSSPVIDCIKNVIEARKKITEALISTRDDERNSGGFGRDKGTIISTLYE